MKKVRKKEEIITVNKHKLYNEEKKKNEKTKHTDIEKMNEKIFCILRLRLRDRGAIWWARGHMMN